MSSFNRVILMGNLTRDPRLTYTPSNTAVCEFGLASNRRWRDRDGNQKEDTCFVDVAAFGRQAETINQYMSKGRSILIEGRLKFDSWTAQDGSKRSKLSVVVENFTFVGSGRDGGSGGSGGGGDVGRGGPPPADRGGDDGGYGGSEPPPAGDDIPF
jgi:single-strand DNA-binding protein